MKHWRALVLAGLMIVAVADTAIAVDPSQCCAGDCNGDGSVTIGDLIKLVDIALGNLPGGSCACIPQCGVPPGVECFIMLQAVNNALAGCPS